MAKAVKRFARDAPDSLAQLSEELRVGSYYPRPLTAISIPKESGGTRELHLGTVRDRVVERALAVMLTPRLDPLFDPASFGYRQGIGVSDAVRYLATLRDEGLRFVVRADIDDCFPTIDRERLIAMVRACIHDVTIVDLIDALVRRPVRGDRRGWSRRFGIGQGSALSPLLSNLYLTDLDRYLLRCGLVHLRYGDDIVLAVSGRREAELGLLALERAVARGGQKLGSDKTEVTSFDEGFAFLGEEFNNRYPQVPENARRGEPRRRTLHVRAQGSGVRLSKGRVVVERDESTLLSVPQGHVGRIVTSGSVGVSSGLRSWALHDGVDVVMLSRRGNFLGSLQSARTAEAALRRAQYRLTSDSAWGLPIARAICFGKLSNQRTLLLRYARRDNARSLVEIVEELERYREFVHGAEGIRELMGVEGIAARKYWDGIKLLVAPYDLDFSGRVRNPPTDVVNSALGYGYAILLGECVAACRVVGIDEAAGVFHRDHERRPSLALDLMEEYRPLVVDSVVVEAIRRHRLTVHHGRSDDRRPDGVLLTAKGVRVLVKAVEDRLLREFRHPTIGQRMTYRRSIRLQAGQIARAVRSGEAKFEPVLWRA